MRESLEKQDLQICKIYGTYFNGKVGKGIFGVGGIKEDEDTDVLRE